MSKEKILRENEILKKRMKAIYELMEGAGSTEEAYRAAGRCQGIIICTQELDKIELGIVEREEG